MMPGVVSLPHGWGHNLPGTQQALAAERPGANLNALLDEQLRDPLSGNAVLNGQAITMVPLADAPVPASDDAHTDRAQLPARLSKS